MTSPAAAIAAASYGVRTALPLDLIVIREKPIVFGTAADSPQPPHARFLSLLIFQNQNARGYYAKWLCPTKQTPGRVHTAGGRATYREMYRHAYTHIHFLLGLLLQLLLKLLLLSRNAHSHAVRLKSPIRDARRGCQRQNSHRGA